VICGCAISRRDCLIIGDGFQAKRERGAAAGRFLDFNRAPMRRGNLGNDGKSQPRPCSAARPRQNRSKM
jgi:hypothetical protein